MSHRKGVQVNQGLNTDISFAFFPARLIAPATIIFCTGFILKAVIPGLSWILVIIVCVGLIVFWFLLTWKGNYFYLSQFARYFLPNWRARSWKHHRTKAPTLLKPKCVSPQIPLQKGKAPFEQFNLVSLLEFQYEGQTVGGYLLKRDSLLSQLLGNQAIDWQVVFCWQSQGYHAYQTEEAFEALQYRVDRALRELPVGEQLALSSRRVIAKMLT